MGMGNLFKAKRADNGEWVEGYYIHDDISDKSYIFPKDSQANESDKVGEEGCLRLLTFEVDPSTICRYTGLTDKNGKKVWENDIVRRTDLYNVKEPSIGFVEYDAENTAFLIHWIDVINYSATYPWKERIEVTGSIFDNTEFLQRQQVENLSGIRPECTLPDIKGLRKLILENPDLPLIIFCGEDANTGEYAYEASDSASVELEELTFYNNFWIDKNDYEEQLADNMCNMADFKDMPDWEFDRLINKKVEETEFIKAITVTIG